MCARDEIDNKNKMAIEEKLQSMPQIINKYLSHISQKTSYTKKAYIYYIKKFLEYAANTLNIDINKTDEYRHIKSMDIDSYMESIRYNDNGKEKSATYRAAQLAAINSLFDFLEKNDIVNNNPCKTIDKPKDNTYHEIITIDNDDLSVMINNIKSGVGSKRSKHRQEKWKNRDLALVQLGISTGLRVSAIVGLDVDDINFDENYIVVTEKGNITKKVFIGENLTGTLYDWILDRREMGFKNNNALFVSEKGNRLSVRMVQVIIKRASTGINKKITPHKMRSTCATRLYEATGDIYRVQQQLGHKNIQNTQRYAKQSEKRQRESANILDSMF